MSSSYIQLQLTYSAESQSMSLANVTRVCAMLFDLVPDSYDSTFVCPSVLCVGAGKSEIAAQFQNRSVGNLGGEDGHH